MTKRGSRHGRTSGPTAATTEPAGPAADQARRGDIGGRVEANDATYRVSARI